MVKRKRQLLSSKIITRDLLVITLHLHWKSNCKRITIVLIKLLLVALYIQIEISNNLLRYYYKKFSPWVHWWKKTMGPLTFHILYSSPIKVKTCFRMQSNRLRLKWWESLNQWKIMGATLIKVYQQRTTSRTTSKKLFNDCTILFINIFIRIKRTFHPVW